jgi:abhydrolase domain-containing protein 14
MRPLILALLVVHSADSAAAGGADLLAGLRDAYHDTGAVTAHEAHVAGIDSPVHYLQAGSPSATRLVLLLHGLAFRADVWKFTGTLDALAGAGTRAIALDLPGYAGAFATDAVRARLVRDFLVAISWPEGHRVVVLAASMGGLVGAPYVLQAGEAAVAGYISVSALLSSEGGTGSAVPALLIWGEYDSPESTKARAHEQLFPSHQKVVIPRAPHPAYLKDPQLFNSLVVRFVTGAPPGSSKLQSLLASKGPPPVKVNAQWGAGQPFVKQKRSEL